MLRKKKNCIPSIKELRSTGFFVLLLVCETVLAFRIENEQKKLPRLLRDP